MDELTKEAYDLLVKVVVLCQMPRKDWSRDDYQALQDARKFIKLHETTRTSVAEE
jgi:hypothetical protein